MFVSGFTIARNVIKYDYPIKEAILSILPIVDEMIVLVGNSEDDTENYIRSIDNPKIKIFNSVWDDKLREGGRVLADETNKAFAKINPKADWAFYIQADECVHEKYHDSIKQTLLKYRKNKSIDGLLFNYTHFYGSYDYVATSRSFYKKEIRIIRNDKNILSHGDAQGFRFRNGSKLHVKQIDANIFHYGWVKHPMKMTEKVKGFHKMWHSDDWIESQQSLNNEWDYNLVEKAEIYKETHPNVMLERIKSQNWNFEFDQSKVKVSFKNKIIYFFEKYLGYSIAEYKNYILLK